MSNALIRGESVKISSFGSFTIRNKSERIGRNPKREEVPITPRRVLFLNLHTCSKVESILLKISK